MVEDKIQAEIYKWYNNNYCLAHHNPRNIIFAVPNGGFRSKIEAMKMATTGTRAGVSDLIIVRPNEILFIEVKTDIGKQSKEQIDFEKIIKQLGYRYIIARNLKEFKKIVGS